MPTPTAHGAAADTQVQSLAAQTSTTVYPPGLFEVEYLIGLAHATLAAKAGTGTEYAAAETALTNAATMYDKGIDVRAVLLQARLAVLHAQRAN